MSYHLEPYRLIPPLGRIFKDVKMQSHCSSLFNPKANITTYFLLRNFFTTFLSVTGLIIPASRLNSSSGVITSLLVESRALGCER